MESFGSIWVVMGLFFKPNSLINLSENPVQDSLGKAILCAAKVPVAPENFASKVCFFMYVICLSSLL